MIDAISAFKNTARVVFARGLSAFSDAQDAAEASGERALHTLGLPTHSDIDRLNMAVADLTRVAESLRSRS